ncbi:MAG: type III-B CRISPR module RAMP protein Cmr4 [Myxococcota bacterium]
MKAILMGLLAETAIHPGAGRNLGVVDLPVAREAATDYPVLVGSSLKGALRDHAEQSWTPKDARVAKLYGQPDEKGQEGHAGGLVVSDGRLILLPVRSLTGSYRWLTCPHILERLHRDFKRAGLEPGFTVPRVLRASAEDAQEPALASGKTPTLFLEERQFSIQGAPGEDLIATLGLLIDYDDTRARLPHQLVIVTDDAFSWFVRYGLPIQTRNRLDSETKTSKGLWHEESLPPDTLMSALLVARRNDASTHIQDQLGSSPWLQTGGNETVGQGWFRLKLNLTEG